MQKKYTRSLELIIFVGFLFVSAQAENIFRQASLGDADEILNLYSNFSESDKEHLLVYPTEIQRKIIVENISKERLFLAVDQENGSIVSFLKLHIADQDEINFELTKGLHLGLESHLIKDCCYEFSHENIGEFKLPLKQCEKSTLNKVEKELIRDNKLNSCLYLYAGAEYTVLPYRGRGISTQLLEYSFNSIKEKLLDKNFIILLYGQVGNNSNKVNLIHVFAKCMAKIFSEKTQEGLQLQHLCGSFYKPEFNTTGEFVWIEDEKHAGIGSMLIYKK